MPAVSKRGHDGSESVNKRQRLPEGSDNTSRSESFWLDDGNIILQTADGTQFRVHKSILARNSAFFLDKFASNASEVAQEVVDGCPAVHMPEERAEWEPIFNALYNPTQLHSDLHDLAEKDFASMLRLGNRYQFYGLLARAPGRLKLQFPTTLSEFDNKYRSHFVGLSSGACDCENVACDFRGTLVETINYAVKFNIRSVLPVAYYLASMCYTFDEIFDGLRNPGTIQTVLCRDAQRAILKGRTAIRQDLYAKCFPWLSGTFGTPIVPSRTCANPEECENKRKHSNDEIFLFSVSDADNTYVYSLALYDPSPSVDIHRIRDGLCPSCTIVLEQHYNECRNHAFKRLPEYFGLGSWDKLQSS